MKGMACSVLFMVASVLIMVQAGRAMSRLTCGQVDTLLAPCIPYLTHGGEPGPECCNGVRSTKALAQNREDKRQVCICVKEAANRYANLEDDAVQALPVKCGVDVDIPVSRKINCDVIN